MPSRRLILICAALAAAGCGREKPLGTVPSELLDRATGGDELEPEPARQLGEDGEAASPAVAEALTDYGVESRDDELLYIGLALEAVALRASGALDRAGPTADRFLARWIETGGFTI